MISVVLCKVSQPSLLKRKSYDGKFATAKCSNINDGATLTLYYLIYIIQLLHRKPIDIYINLAKSAEHTTSDVLCHSLYRMLPFLYADTCKLKLESVFQYFSRH